MNGMLSFHRQQALCKIGERLYSYLFGVSLVGYHRWVFIGCLNPVME